MSVELTELEAEMLAGSHGAATALAMRIVMAAARTQAAPRLLTVKSAHVDSCLYHGPSSLDFVRTLVEGGAQVSVPTTLNVGGLDLTRPDLFRGAEPVGAAARELMTGYVSLGCRPTFTCAPYQLPGRPAFGEDVAWAESNAIVFGNSMIGLRTNRYGDLIDICAAITGRVPYCGLHVEANRRAEMVFTVGDDVVEATDSDLLPSLLGHHIGRRTGSLIPALSGLSSVQITEDWGKNFGAAAASSGGVALFHLVGVTPEAPDLATALHGQDPVRLESVTLDDLRQARRELTTASSGEPLGGVSIGTPHLSRTQLVEMATQLRGQQVRVPTYATTSRSVLAAEPGAQQILEASGVTIVRDTCTYGQSVIMQPEGAVMTNSAKWAYYAPAHLGFSVMLASVTDCLLSAVRGEITVTDGSLR
ncbi:aconitase X catalytic domain-containing protein [Mycobacterium sp. 155]|uniref:aconitase X n=1 Tax=Mycobacterium sp. 155 TaxID=1157943 RepID=UPI00047666D4|nr:aconitase X catalytic domain-containing protein [Mycobacterium sp. 155]